MKTFRLISIITLLLLTSCVVVSCSSPKLVDQTGTTLPDWVADPSVSDGIGGVGIAPKSKGGIRFQIPIAELAAKAEIASRINLEINRVTKTAMRSGAVNQADDVEDFFSQATKEVIKKQELHGVKRDKMYQAPDGTLYIHMVMNEKEYLKYLNTLEDALTAQTKRSNLSRNNIDKTQEAVKEVFDELEKERSGL